MIQEALQGLAVLCRELLEHDQRRVQTACVCHDVGGEKPGVGTQQQFGAVEVTLPGSASDHQCSHFQEARPHAPDRIDQRSDPRTHASDEILIEDEKRLNCTDRATLVLNGEIPVLEFLPDRILH